MVSNDYNRTFVIAESAGQKLNKKKKNKTDIKEENNAKHVHDWDGCKCQTCGETRDTGHDWDGCICKACGKENHDWDGCVCKNCGKIGALEWLESDT